MGDTKTRKRRPVSDADLPKPYTFEPRGVLPERLWSEDQKSHPQGRRPNQTQLRALCQEMSVDACFRLYHLMFNAEDENTQLRATVEILNRGFGKPKETVDVTTSSATLVDVLVHFAADARNTLRAEAVDGEAGHIRGASVPGEAAALAAISASSDSEK